MPSRDIDTPPAAPVTSPSIAGSMPSPNAISAAFLVAVVILLLHSHLYAFLTDDAFISFRYARNLAHGDGLIFNPGGDRVEGYTNFLWVIILAGLTLLGIPPHRAANPLSLAATIALMVVVFRFGCRRLGPASPLCLVAPFLLAINRSFAVWSTSGLETRLFELLAIAGVLGFVESLTREPEARGIGPASLLALAGLTRPDGALVALTAFAATSAIAIRRAGIRRNLGWITRSGAVIVLPLAAHLAFRLAYYGDIVPNTYYAKVGGETWWSMGFLYASTFALEYGLLLWVPLIAAGIVLSARRDAASDLWVIACAVLIPHLLYIMAIGGDHFEWRPLDLWVPFLALAVQDGSAELTRIGRARLAAVLLVPVVMASVFIPMLSHLDFPRSYISGFPSHGRPDGSRDLIRSDRAVARIPLVGAAIRGFNDRLFTLSMHFVGLRAEEHRLFLDTVIDEGPTLRKWVREGILPADTRIALSCVGAIPYFSDLYTVDRLGLTDAFVAHLPFERSKLRVMAHSKQAPDLYLVEQKVELSAPVQFLCSAEEVATTWRLARQINERTIYVSPVPVPGKVFMTRLPLGIAHARQRFPRLDLRLLIDLEEPPKPQG